MNTPICAPVGIPVAKRPAPAGRRRRGFTLTELMVTVAIIAILLGIAVPAMDSVIMSGKLTSSANSLVASALLARNEAIKRRSAITLCPSSTGSGCTAGDWDQGWILMCNTSDNATCDSAGAGTLVLQKYPALSSGYKILNGNSGVDFQPTGIGMTNKGTMTSTSLSLTVCRASPLGDQERVVSISSTGRPSAKKTTNGACS